MTACHEKLGSEGTEMRAGAREENEWLRVKGGMGANLGEDPGVAQGEQSHGTLGWGTKLRAGHSSRGSVVTGEI